MASRENQRYLIAIIVLSLFLIAFFITSLLGWSKVYEYSDIAESSKAKLKLAQSLQEAYAAKASVLETMIGGSGGSVNEIQTTIDSLPGIARKVDSGDKSKIDAVAETIKKVKDLYDKDMKSSSSAGADEELNLTYKSLIANLNSVTAKLHNEVQVKTRDFIKYRIETDAEITQVKADRAAIQTNLSETEKQLEETKNASRVKENDLKNKMASQQETMEKSQEARKRERQVAKDEKKLLQSEKAEVVRKIGNLKQKVDEYEREVFNIPDGKIVKIAEGLGTVVLNIGRADGLRVNRTFAVYDQSVSNFEKGQNKASIEITRLIGDKDAEARITQQDPLNPILPNDYVLSPTWDPGYSTPIALAGAFDLDDDGFSDFNKLKQMVKLNGGDVRVFHDEQGNITGTVDPSIRYLVLGTAPVEGPEANPEVVEAMKIMAEQAQLNTVQVIDLRKLLNWMGVHGRAKVEKLGGIREEFQTRRPTGAGSEGSGSSTRSSEGSGSSTRSSEGSGSSTRSLEGSSSSTRSLEGSSTRGGSSSR